MHQQASSNHNDNTQAQSKQSVEPNKSAKAQSKSTIQAKQKPIQAKQRPVQAKQKPIQAKQRPVQAKQKPVQRNSAGQTKQPQGSAKFKEIATTMGQQHGVDTSSLKANHNSPFPDTVNAEATIQGSKIDFAPGKDTESNIKHEVAHAIDNAKNGTPKGDQVVNGQSVDTTREQVVDQMAAQPLQRKADEKVSSNETNTSTLSLASPVQRIINTKIKNHTSKKGDVSDRAVYNKSGQRVGTLPEGTVVTVNDKSFLKKIWGTNTKIPLPRKVYKILSYDGTVQDVEREFQPGELYVLAGGIMAEENEKPVKLKNFKKNESSQLGPTILDEEAQAEFEASQTKKSVDGPACWNWALLGAVSEDVRVPKSTAMFGYVSSQVPSNVGGTGIGLGRDDAYTMFVQNELNEAEKNRFDNARERLDATVTHLKEVSRRQGSAKKIGKARKKAVKQATQQVMINTIESYGLRVLPLGTKNTWKICMHERPDKIGYEHWWVKDPNGQLVETFPGLNKLQYVQKGKKEIDNEQEHISDGLAMNVFRIPVAELTPEHYNKMRADGRLA